MGSDVTRHHFATTDPEAANAFLDEVYADQVLIVRGPPEDFRFAQSSVATDRFAFGRIRASPLSTEVQPFDDLLVVSTVRTGGLSFDRCGYAGATGGRDDVLLAPPEETFRALVETTDVDTVTLAFSDVALYASSMTGLDPDRLRFTGLAPVSEGIAEHWRATTAHVRDTAFDDATSTPVIAETAFRLLAAALLCGFPSTAPDALTGHGSGRWMATRRLDEIVERLRVHAAEPLGPEDCAQLAGAPVREIDHALRRQCNTTAARELWRARLRGAHRDLRDAEPRPDAVADIAGRWGFLGSASFRVAYTWAHHGEAPEETLRR